MDYLITLLIISAGFFLASTLVKSEHWFVRLFFLCQVGYLVSFILSLLIGAYFFSMLLAFALILTGYKVYKASKSENDRGISIIKECYKTNKECIHNCPGQCRESC